MTTGMEQQMGIDVRLELFIGQIDDYINNRNLAPKDFDDELKEAENLSLDGLQALTQDDCFNYAFQLYQFADYIGQERAKCETVLRWCENALNNILSWEMEELSHVIAKHEMKVSRILRNNDLARKVNEMKMNAEAKFETLKSRDYNVRRKADILMEKGKRK